jgi:hypothetical protein
MSTEKYCFRPSMYQSARRICFLHNIRPSILGTKAGTSAGQMRRPNEPETVERLTRSKGYVTKALRKREYGEKG